MAKKLEDEVWKPIPGFSGYEASTYGRVRSIDRETPVNGGIRKSKGRILQGWTPGKHDCYPRYGLKPDGKTKQIVVKEGKAVCLAFHGLAPPDKPWVLHRDDNPLNNVPSNVYWGSPTQNVEDRRKNGNWRRVFNGKLRKQISQETADEIKKKFEQGVGRRHLTEEYGIDRSSVFRITKGEFPFGSKKPNGQL